MDELSVQSLFVTFGGLIGLSFGLVAQASQFCIQRGISDFANGLGTESLTAWFAAIAVALPVTHWLTLEGILDIAQTAYFPSSLSIMTTLVGASLFGTGMVLARGCPARLLVLAGTGNLRAWFCILVIGLVGYATFKGLLSQIRVDLQQQISAEFPQESIWLVLGQGSLLVVALVTLVFVWAAIRHGLQKNLIAGLLVGCIVVCAWYITGIYGADEFDPMRPFSLSFVAPLGEAMVYMQLASALEPTFNTAMIVGVLIGSFLMSLIKGQFALQTFETTSDHARYFLGSAFMGCGGILALGCTLGATVSGFSTGSLWSILITVVIFGVGYLTHLFLK